MSLGPDSSHLSVGDLSGPLPWSFVVDEQLRITYVGESLGRHVHGICSGVLFTDCISIVRPQCSVSSIEDLKQIAGRLIVMNVEGLCVQLRGATFSMRSGQACMIAAVPLIRSHTEFVESGLQLNDFAPQDSVPDLLFALQARDVAISEFEESSRHREEDRGRLKSILNSALDAMITIDEQGTVVEFNNVACVLFGYERDLAIGKDLKTLIIPSEQHAMHEAGLKRFRETSEGPILNKRIEVAAVNKQGREFPVELAIIPFMHQGNQYFTATIRDLSAEHEHKQAIAAAAEKEHLLRRELDHRVKNMLAQILVLCSDAEAKSTADQDVVVSLRRRIQNFSAVHDLLSKEQVAGVELRELTSAGRGPPRGALNFPQIH